MSKYNLMFDTWNPLNVCKQMSYDNFLNVPYKQFIYKSNIFKICRSHNSNVQNKQQEQDLTVQQPQLADKK